MSELEVDWSTVSREPNWIEWAEAQKRWLWVVLDESDFGMEWREPRPGRNRNVFKGSFLVSTLLDQHSNRFKSRAAAVKFAKRLFRESKIKSIFGAGYFEDSAQLYMWNDDVLGQLQRSAMTSTSVDASKESRYDRKVIDDARSRILNRGEQINLVKPFSNSEHRTEKDSIRSGELEFMLTKRNGGVVRYVPGFSQKYLAGEKPQSNPKSKVSGSPIRQYKDLSSQYHKSIPIMSSEKVDPKEFDMVGNVTGTMNSQASSAVTGESVDNNRRWGENAYSYSDNEKQLIEEMKRMKKEHQHILKTYEERINKLMAKMHELRSIAEMLENSSTKSSPYGILPNKANILSIIGSKLEEERKQAGLLGSHDEDAPPPLPPRPSRGNKVYPNKPIIHTTVKMKNLPWTRIIVADENDNGPTSIWHSMMEPKIDGEELEKLFCATKETLEDISLFDDVYVKRGRPKQQLVNIFDNGKAQRIIMEMRNVRCTLNDLIHSVSHLDTKDISQESLAQLLDLISSSRDIEKVLHHIKRKGTTQLDYPEYLISELSKIDHFRERLDFLRFKEKLQINLFEIEQQLRELHTACDEITNSIALKNLLGTLLTVGNYLNGGTDRGQADGYQLDILSKLKDVSNKTHRGNLHEFIVKCYCKVYESDVEWGCPTRFRLPEPSNMRHAAQVSFEDIQRALSSLRQELHTVRERIESLARKENSKVTYQLKVISDNYFTSAVEVLSEEDKLLEDTKKYFTRTTIFFNHDCRNCTPQEFFQIWASFLHDTKFYWKLAHRNIAKAKFEHEFASKNQMSSASHHSRGRYRSEVRKHLLNLGEEHDRHISRAQQLKHINNWIESVGKYAEEIKTEIPPPSSNRNHSSKNDSKQPSSSHRSNRPSSPKPLTSTPPNVHKPLALSHNSPTQTLPPFAANGNHNYMNQESPYDTLKEQNGDHENALEQDNQHTTSSPEHSSQKKNSTQFSLRSWLKREQTKRGDDGNHAQKSLTPGSTGTLGKIRNTVVNKFSNSKRPNDAPQETVKNENERRSKDTGVNCSSQQQYPHHQNIHYSPEMNGNTLPETNTYTERAKGDYQGLYFEVPISRDSGYQGQNSNPSTLSSTKSRDLSPPRYDYSKEKQFTNLRTFEIKSPPNNDVNNNKKYRNIPPETPPKPLRSKDRVALAQMNEHNVNDGYMKNASSDTTTIPQTSVMKSESVPVYKAKLIPNYENQTNTRMQGVRCQAEPLQASHKTQLSNSSDAYRNELARKSEMFVKLGYQSAGHQQKYTNTLSPETQRITGSNSDFNRSPQQHFGEYPARRSASTQDILEKHANTIVSPHSSSEPRQISNNRPSGNSSSVTNLIDKFEKSPNPIEGEKPPSMTSTPLTHRRNPQVLKDHESYNMTPHKPRSLDRTQQRSRESSQQRYRDSSQNRRQNFQTSPPQQLQPDYNHDSSAGRSNHKSSAHPIPKPRRNQASSLSPNNQENQQALPFQHQNYHHHGQFNHQQQGHHQYHQQSNQRQHQHNPKPNNNLQVSPQYGVYKAVPVSYPQSSPDNTYGFSDPEDNNYTDQLRKASKAKGNGTAFDRYQSTTSPQYSRHVTGAMAVVHPTVVHQSAMEI